MTIPGHFACSSFAMHRHLTAAPPVRTASRDNGPRQVVLVCLRLRAPPDGGIVRRLPHSCRFLLSVISAFSTRPRYYWVDARFALDQQWTAGGQLCNTIARMIVDDGDESAQRRCAAKVAVCRCRAEAKIEICWHARKRTVEILLLPHEYLYIYIYI